MPVIHSEQAPEAIGTYSQAIRNGNTIYFSGQIPLNPRTMALCSDDINEQIEQVFKNLKAVAEAAGGLLSDFVKINVYLTDLSHFSSVNEIMAYYFIKPYPARAVIGVAALPRGAMVEIDGIMVLPS